MKARYAMNRELLMRRLPELGFRLAAPMDGAFYAFCDVSGLTNDSMAFARRMLARGACRGDARARLRSVRGHRFMRFSYAGSHEDMIAGDRPDRALAGPIAGMKKPGQAPVSPHYY